jgi:hypothetical protein
MPCARAPDNQGGCQLNSLDHVKLQHAERVGWRAVFCEEHSRFGQGGGERVEAGVPRVEAGYPELRQGTSVEAGVPRLRQWYPELRPVRRRPGTKRLASASLASATEQASAHQCERDQTQNVEGHK